MNTFTVSTKPLSNALDLAVLNSVSDYDSIGILAQVTMEGRQLRINFQYPRITTEIRLKGAPSNENASCTVFVKNSVLKQIVSTLETNTIDLEFADGGLIIGSGKSRFSVSKLTDEEDLALKRPQESDYTEGSKNLNTEFWKYVKNNQTHVLVSSYEYPVYNAVWVSDESDVLAGDITDSLFAHSKKSDLGQTCLLSPTIIDLFSSVPDNATFKQHGTDYLISVIGEGYEYITEIKPQHESDADMGDYNSAIILGEMKHPESYVSVNPESIRKVLNQAALLSTVSDDVITVTLSTALMNLKNSNVDCFIDVKCSEDALDNQGSCDFTTKHLKQLLKPYSGESVNISLLMDGDEAKGIIIFDDELTMVVGGVD